MKDPGTKKDLKEKEEEANLEDCLNRLDDNRRLMNKRIRDYDMEVKEANAYMWQAQRDMDHIEKIAVRQTIEQKMRSADVLRAQEQKLSKLKNSPYFGRFDFSRSDSNSGQREPIYVGMHSFFDDASDKTYVYDWRAPISAMFYDYELGPAKYLAPSGEISGNIDIKRQFRIKQSRMEFMIESGVNIVDDVLQEELSRSSDQGMKHIVSTIQRDQNAIIRNSDASTLIIQGVAGSGKTSIALHRIAYLLYQFKDTLSSEDILIISPNRVFAQYIGNVLPELGEEKVGEMGIEALANELLQDKFKFQTFFEQISHMLEKSDEAFKERAQYKASLVFLKQIDKYVAYLDSHSLAATEWRTGHRIVPQWFFEEAWVKHKRLPINKRIRELLSDTVYQIRKHYNYDLRPEERRNLRSSLNKMVKKTTLRSAYKNLFEWLGKPELFKSKGHTLEYADVFPLIYLKIRLEGIENPYKNIKHLLIDEMQDYTPVQYAVLAKLFRCDKTILGDATQSVSLGTATNSEIIQQVLPSSTGVKLNKSYRSTWEIMQFALKISPNKELIAMKRHGKAPELIVCKRQKEILEHTIASINDFESSEHKSLAIISKTQKGAEKLHSRLSEEGLETRLLDSESGDFSSGVLLCTAHLAKGLEFDRVLIPDASPDIYHTELDRNLLYVACTRAMHRLTLLALGDSLEYLR